uniref:Beclin-1 n=1 Tax=Ciona savignyi TaxID=51511 RepID=H2YYT8_CIOSA
LQTARIKMEDDSICFMCARCKQLIKLDPSFDSIDPQTIQELTSSHTSQMITPLNPPQEQEVSSSGSDHQLDGADSIYSQNAPSSSNDVQESTNSFTFIGDTSMENLSNKMKAIVRLFDVLSEDSELEHPLCEECNDVLLNELNEELKSTEAECNLYKNYLATLKEEQCDHETVANLTEELKKLKTEESDLLSQLSETEKEREEVKKEMGEIRKQQEALDKEEEKQLQEYAELRVQQIELEEEQCSADLQMAHTEHQLNKLKKTNVFNSTFHIWHQGHFGTINGFRLGRLPGANVEWTEINAAWGQVVLLLASLAKKMGLKLKRYKLVPYGNHSYIESVDDKGKELPLYGSGGLRFLWDTKFDQAMVAFLDCLQQFKEAVEGNSGFSLPYRMEKGKIEDTGGSGASYSIKMQFNSEEQWTKALKFMLTNLKWGLAWVSSQFTSS